MTAAPYGSWKSPITPTMIVSHEIRLGGAGEKPDGYVYWLESRPLEKGRSTIVQRSPDGTLKDLLPINYNSRTRVHEYGGGSYIVDGQTLYFTNYEDQQIYQCSPNGSIVRLTNYENGRFADGCASPKYLFCVLEIHGKTVENCLAAVDKKTGAVQKIASGYDFYTRPRLSPDGKSLSYICWKDPNMPWDGSELWVAEINPDGTLSQSRLIAGGTEESISQSSWGPDGQLYFISDRSGWWNLYRENEGRVEPLHPMEAEFTTPDWWLGQQTYDFWGTDKIVCAYSEKGVDHLAILSLKDGSLRSLKMPYNQIQALSVTGNHLYITAGSATETKAIVEYNLKSGRTQILKKSRDLALDPSYISVAQPIEFPTTDNKTAYAFYYPPKNPQYKGLPGETPPLRLISHGGPTGQTTAELDLEIQYWTSRGFAVVDVNYGGSSGYGRAYRERLTKNWGIVDVDDCCNAALYLVKKNLADAKRLAIAGGSAGGYTTLASLAFRDVFKAGASYFGVSDLEALVLDTHKFEARYLDKLIGPYPADRDLYLARSPLYFVDQIHCPVILLQGDEDLIVPPPQSEKMYESLKKRGIPTAYLLFKNEQHGFRQAENIQRALEAELYFYSKVFDFSLGDPVPPIDIANLKN
ncbi:MAG: S9 family peptidase [Verrucomicrobia bacterium]|nr:S9 family peptidase [Verrucomicrobiota bacterium]